MTQKELNMANELDKEIKKLKSFLAYYNNPMYLISIRLDNKNENCFHSERLSLDGLDKLIKQIESSLLEELNEKENYFKKI